MKPRAGACLAAVMLAAVTAVLPAAAGTDTAVAAWQAGLRAKNGDGVARDPVRAVALLTQAAEGGLAPAMFVLANMLAAGEGAPRDEAASRRWLEAAAARDHPEALQQLALIEPDPRKAELLMRQAGHAMMHRGR